MEIDMLKNNKLIKIISYDIIYLIVYLSILLLIFIYSYISFSILGNEKDISHIYNWGKISIFSIQDQKYPSFEKIKYFNIYAISIILDLSIIFLSIMISLNILRVLLFLLIDRIRKIVDNKKLDKFSNFLQKEARAIIYVPALFIPFIIHYIIPGIFVKNLTYVLEDNKILNYMIYKIFQVSIFAPLINFYTKLVPRILAKRLLSEEEFNRFVDIKFSRKKNIWDYILLIFGTLCIIFGPF